MGRPARKRPGSNAKKVDRSTLHLDWGRIEDECDCKLSSKTRKEIKNATLGFLDRVPFEVASRSAINPKTRQHPAQNGIRKIREGAAAIIRQMVENADDELTFESNYLVAMNFNELLKSGARPALPPVEWTWETKFKPLKDYVMTIVMACDKALAELDQLETGASLYWRQGAAWDAWVNRLSQIRGNTGRNATTRSEDLTDFVRLVGVLESFMPDEYLLLRKPSALSRAIARALDRPDSNRGQTDT